MDNAILDIEAVRARHAAATKGPYRYSGKSGDGKRQFIESTGDDDGWHLLRAEVDSDDCDYDEAVNNAIFLAASWQDVAKLIAEVERLRALNAAFARLERWLACGWGRTAGPIRHVANYQIDLVGGDDDPDDCGGSGEGPTLADAINAALDAAGAER